jgi:hypothetical protein
VQRKRRTYIRRRKKTRRGEARAGTKGRSNNEKSSYGRIAWGSAAQKDHTSIPTYVRAAVRPRIHRRIMRHIGLYLLINSVSGNKTSRNCMQSLVCDACEPFKKDSKTPATAAINSIFFPFLRSLIASHRSCRHRSGWRKPAGLAAQCGVVVEWTSSPINFLLFAITIIIHSNMNILPHKTQLQIV